MDASDALAFWLAEGQIDAELASRLQSSVDARKVLEPEPEPEPEPASRFIWLLASIGAVLTGGGLLLFIASQWDQSSPARRLFLLLAIYLLSVGAAAVADRQRLRTTATGLWFLSSILVGANIFLTGQVFNLPLSYWQGTLLWMIAALAMGWASPSRAQGWLVVPLAVLTLGWISTPTSEFFGQWAFLVGPGGIRPLLPLIGLALVAVSIWVAGNPFGWLSAPARAIGAVLIAVPILVSTFHPVAFAYVFQIDVRWFHLLAISSCVALVVIVALRQTNQLLSWSLAAVGALLLVILPQASEQNTNVATSSGTTSWLAESFGGSELAFGAYNALILGLGIAAIAAGQRFGVRAMVNGGFWVVGVLLMAIYVGRIAGELPTSFAVILGGLLLLGGAVFLEGKRREVIAEVSL